MASLAFCDFPSFELLARRFQLIEEKYRHRLPQVDAKGADPEADSGLYLGLGPSSSFGKSAVCVCPELASYIGDELTKESSIMKGRVKAVELRKQLRDLNNPKGGIVTVYAQHS